MRLNVQNKIEKISKLKLNFIVSSKCLQIYRNFSISKKQISINEKPCCIILLELNVKLLLNEPINSAISVQAWWYRTILLVKGNKKLTLVQFQERNDLTN